MNYTPSAATDVTISSHAPHDDFWIGDWHVEPQRCQITQGYRVRKLQPRLMDLLIYLALHQDRIVSREEILKAVWTTPHVTPHALSNAVSKLRRALGDDARDQSYIATRRGFGYRLIVKSRRIVGSEAATGISLIQSPEPPKTRRSINIGLGIAALALIVMGSVIHAGRNDDRIALDYSNDAQAAIALLQNNGWQIVYENEAKGVRPSEKVNSEIENAARNAP